MDMYEEHAYPGPYQVRYAVDVPSSKRKAKFRVGLIQVEITRAFTDVVTKSGTPGGITIVCKVTNQHGNVFEDYATWAPEYDKDGKVRFPYDFAKGAKIALSRVLEKLKDSNRMCKTSRTAVWTGFFNAIGVKY